MTDAAAPAPAGAWEPLADRVFRMLWLASLATNVGTWMQNVGAVAQMTQMDSSPVLIALVQTATSLPIFILGLPAGAVADLVDRRRLLLVAQAWMLATALALVLLSAGHRMNPGLLLVLTFALGAGVAATTPTWNAVIKDLVPRTQLTAAVTLNGVAINLARAVGPVLAGIVVSLRGPAAVFALNAVSFLIVIAAVLHWRPAPWQPPTEAEGMWRAVGSGVRYAVKTRDLLAVLVRTLCFVLPASALWALLPLVAHRTLGSASTGYGLLLGCLGAGAVAGAGLLPRMRRRLQPNSLGVVSSAAFALMTGVAAISPVAAIVAAAVFLAGIAWIGNISTFNALTQIVVPDWVRARSLSIYLLVYQGSMAAGSAAFGTVAARAGTARALLVAAALMLALIALSSAFPLTARVAPELAGQAEEVRA